jgi:hypothetical protein
MNSLRAILRRWVVVFVSAATLAVGGLAVATAPASPAAGAATTGRSLAGDHISRSLHEAAVSGDGDVNNATWMHDLAPHIWYRKLSQVVIPGTHDSASYDLWGPPLPPMRSPRTRTSPAN